ncbi:Lysosomal-associated transmembrane protein 5 [Camelus dromedarius]|uniref:Lysosomal-associated transmembrane protein 5 n=1 Tax=Camelus dromedarius TaxID=9838 RepID=A0A5N4DE33_CAMDR|nr:Lysosomal-associated transmembrane protein 5 [Camelus dromedarius]
MAPRTAAVRQTCCCFNVRIATTALAIYHVIMSILLFIEHSVEVAHGKASCKFSKTVYLRIAELISSFLLIVMLFFISLSLLMGVVKNREKYLLPFLSLQIMDFLLCLLTLLGSYIELPAYLKFASRSTRRANYLPSQEGMAHNQFIKMMIIFSVAFITVLVLKVYMFKCVWKCYRFIRYMNSAEGRSGSKMLSKVVLPSYEEAVSLPYKIPEGGLAPPPYSEV